jgi:oxaloacetate decarboxylase (Na+ extruding) subunit gamma
MQTDLVALLTESATLMLVGMSVVYLFLSILIAAVKLVSMLCARYPGEEKAPQYSGQRVVSRTSSNSAELSPAKVAAISAAVHQFRSANS